jgi:hypothetical protein
VGKMREVFYLNSATEVDELNKGKGRWRGVSDRERTKPVPSGVPRGWFGGFKYSPNFRSFNKTEPNSQFRGKYIRNFFFYSFTVHF